MRAQTGLQSPSIVNLSWTFFASSPSQITTKALSNPNVLLQAQERPNHASKPALCQGHQGMAFFQAELATACPQISENCVSNSVMHLFRLDLVTQFLAKAPIRSKRSAGTLNAKDTESPGPSSRKSTPLTSLKTLLPQSPLVRALFCSPMLESAADFYILFQTVTSPFLPLLTPPRSTATSLDSMRHTPTAVGSATLTLRSINSSPNIWTRLTSNKKY